jgi:hypothetical protein
VSHANVTTVAVINNAISAELVRQDLSARGIPLESLAVITLRDVSESWLQHCAAVLNYPGRPANNLLGQWRFVGYYRAASRLLRRLATESDIRDIYLVNNENLITAHLLTIAESRPAITVSVVAEGIMNFQDIGVTNRAGWRWRVKPIVARLFAFRNRRPHGHLSGSYESRTNRVVSFAAHGLKAPSEKVVLRHFEAVEPVRQGDPDVALVVLTGLNHWMEPAAFETFARAFVAWLEGSGFRKIQVKKHPRVSGGLIEELLAGYDEVGAGQTTEAMATDLEAGTVIGTCCTALVTLKLIRPDLHCVDFGSDYYSQHAYHGDDSVKTLLAATGVTLVQFCATQPAPRSQRDAGA